MNIATFQQSISFFENHALIVAILITSILILKGVALWKAARASQVWWFVILLGVNLFGILEMFYLFSIAPKASAQNEELKNSQEIK